MTRYFKGQFFNSFSFIHKWPSHRRNSSPPKGFRKLRAKLFLFIGFNWKPNPPYWRSLPKLAFCFQTDAVQFNHSKNPKKKHLPRGKCFYSNNVAQLGLEPRTCWLWVSYSNKLSYKAKLFSEEIKVSIGFAKIRFFWNNQNFIDLFP